LEVESLKKQNRVRQLKEENQKKTAQIKELQPVGGGVHHHGHAPVSDHADMQKAEQLIEKNVKEKALVIRTIDDGYEYDDDTDDEYRRMMMTDVSTHSSSDNDVVSVNGPRDSCYTRGSKGRGSRGRTRGSQS
jgi:hypothetical protein